eukprot:NODE_9545_length_1416_cov_6.446082.p1 GENE.NODE_9545_length_1416_cov_6.446082~~NODE_9545_length_1416_cov_6.446082.p1  ORF type:complete len:310 (-),score=62.68 NODE_9545_length_1416_cov_6.446082:383-1312(-)
MESAATAEGTLECIICFESTLECPSLPCACTLPYCMRCWDRSLAQSFRGCGQARCPTCRCPVHVDFDAVTHRLVFSVETEGCESHEETIDRLVEQVRPAQERLLHEYAMQHVAELAREPRAFLMRSSVSELTKYTKATGIDTSDCIEKADLVARLLDSARKDRPEQLPGSWAMHVISTPPECVCGRALKYCPSTGRRSGKICDLCDTSIETRQHGVFTCEANTTTILHATCYDICEICFVRQVSTTVCAAAEALEAATIAATVSDASTKPTGAEPEQLADDRKAAEPLIVEVDRADPAIVGASAVGTEC